MFQDMHGSFGGRPIASEVEKSQARTGALNPNQLAAKGRHFPPERALFRAGECAFKKHNRPYKRVF